MTDEKAPQPTQGDEDLSEYTVTIGGVEHQMMLSEQDAKRYGEDATKGSSSSSGDSSSSGASSGPAKASSAQSKVQTPQNK